MNTLESNWRIAEDLSDHKHIVIDAGRHGCIFIERHVPGHDQFDHA
ncbi:MAG: hypothetical protein HC834_04535 [Rhodospirillales bacterium]|nr:hypothetical protein [Rhodospirillales bacterium]